MADGRKNNGAKKGENRGQGRKPKIEELKLIEKLDNVINYQDALSKLKDLINDGNYNAIKLYFEYRFGKPIDKVDVRTDKEDLAPPQILFTKRDKNK